MFGLSRQVYIKHVYKNATVENIKLDSSYTHLIGKILGLKVYCSYVESSGLGYKCFVSIPCKQIVNSTLVTKQTSSFKGFSDELCNTINNLSSELSSHYKSYKYYTLEDYELKLHFSIDSYKSLLLLISKEYVAEIGNVTQEFVKLLVANKCATCCQKCGENKNQCNWYNNENSLNYLCKACSCELKDEVDEYNVHFELRKPRLFYAIFWTTLATLLIFPISTYLVTDSILELFELNISFDFLWKFVILLFPSIVYHLTIGRRVILGGLLMTLIQLLIYCVSYFMWCFDYVPNISYKFSFYEKVVALFTYINSYSQYNNEFYIMFIIGLFVIFISSMSMFVMEKKKKSKVDINRKNKK